MDGKSIAIISHIPVFGWIIGWILNIENKDEFASFYNRQMLGINILWIALAMLPVLGWLLAIGVFVLWVMSLIAAIQDEKKLTPYIGKYFQDWFKSM